ncbi:hypothetical protein PT2222_100039 [Paraburkholderia tropica]
MGSSARGVVSGCAVWVSDKAAVSGESKGKRKAGARDARWCNCYRRGAFVQRLLQSVRCL